MGRGFLGTGATFYADLNLIVQLQMGAALLVGMVLARNKSFKAHGILQSLVVLLNLVPVLGFMVPLFRKAPALAPLVLAHGVAGSAAEALALFVIAGAWTRRLSNYKLWMRAALGLWWISILLGVALYASTYRPAAAAASAGASEVTVVNFDFSPKTLTVKAGATVTWTGLAKKHGVAADDGSWSATDADVMAGTFKRAFEKPGRYPYNCEYHGEAGGKGMSGVIVVE